MFEISLAPIFISTVLAVALGMLWYSPALFGVLWSREAHLDIRNSDFTREITLQAVVASTLQQLVIMYILAHVLLIARSYPGATPTLVTGWVVLIVVSVQLGSVIWEQRSLTYAAIHAGYIATVLGFAASIITLWPWA
jgi:hypothetical protein